MPVLWRASNLTLGFSCVKPETVIFATSSIFYLNYFLQASDIIPKKLNPIHFSFQSFDSIPPLIIFIEQARVVFSPRYVESLYNASDATEQGSVFAYNSVSSSAYQASKSSALVISVII